MNKNSLDFLLDEINVSSVSNDDEGPEGWFAVSTPNNGIIAYFCFERDAFYYRLALINAKLNDIEKSV